MEIDQKLNSLAVKYKLSNGCREVFEDLYTAFNHHWSPMYKSIAESLYCEVDDVRSLYQLVLFKTVSAYKDGSYVNFLRAALKKERSKLYNKSSRRHYHECSLDSVRSETEEDAPTSILDRLYDSNVYRIEDHVYERMHKKKKADQIALIDFLSDPSQVDNVTTSIVTNFSRYKSVNDLAKGLGIHHETVKRKLIALSRRFDANRFGEKRDYLAV